MQSRNKILDDLSHLMTNAMGVAQGAKTEAETAMKSLIDRWMADRDFVTREEFDAVRAMAQKAREENAALEARAQVQRAHQPRFGWVVQPEHEQPVLWHVVMDFHGVDHSGAPFLRRTAPETLRASASAAA